MAAIVWLLAVSGLVGLASGKTLPEPRTQLLILSVEEVGPVADDSSPWKAANSRWNANWTYEGIFGKEEPLWVTATKQGISTGIFTFLAPDEQSSGSWVTQHLDVDGAKVGLTSELQQLYDWLTREPLKDLVISYWGNEEMNGVRDDKLQRRLELVKETIFYLLESLAKMGYLDDINVMVVGVPFERWSGLEHESKMVAGSGTIIYTSGPGFKEALTESDPYLVACQLLDIDPVGSAIEPESIDMINWDMVSHSYPAIPILAVVAAVILSLVAYCQWRAVQGHDGYEAIKNSTPTPGPSTAAPHSDDRPVQLADV
ncbi:hypothetical protein HDE_01778 [Halotydeus destructor]|nr:hypothetical protein HDE_01778 [Halotydeus destructor]